MNKAFLSLFCIAIALACCSNTKRYYDSTLQYYELEYWGLGGPVKFLTEEGFFRREAVDDIDLDNLNLKEDFRFSFVQDFSFNTEGLMTKQNYYKSDGALSWQLLTYYNNEDQPVNSTVLEGDRTIRYFSEYLYDEMGNLIEELTLSKDSTVRRRKLFDYNSLHQPIEEKWSGTSGPNVHRVFQYDDEGRVIGKKYTTDQNDLRFVYEYTTSGLPSSIVAYNVDSTVSRSEIFEYEDEWLVRKINTNYERETRKVHHFNEKGLLMKIERFNLEDLETDDIDEHHFKYDQHGNWIRRISFKSGALFHVEFRDIEYY